MPGFLGKYYYSVDPKGRIMIPAPYRYILLANYSSKLYITTAVFDKCLCLYPFEEWQKFEERVRSLPQMKKSVKWLMRSVVASAHECEMDRQGRILIPASLRTDCDINGEVAVVGQFDKIEMWNKKEWDKVANPAKLDRDAMAEELASLGM